MQNINPDRPLCRTAQAVGAQLADGYVMLDLDGGKYIELNPTAEAVWNLLDTPRSLSAVSDLLGSRFDVEPERCRTEVAALLEHFLDLKIVAYQS